MKYFLYIFLDFSHCEQGLSDDFYEVFMTMSGRESDLKLLKTLAQNSIKYSALSSHRRLRCQEMWEEKWNSFTHSTFLLKCTVQCGNNTIVEYCVNQLYRPHCSFGNINLREMLVPLLNFPNGRLMHAYCAGMIFLNRRSMSNV